MELDKRIKEGKRPLTAFDEMESKFIGTDCYFSDKASDFGDLSNCQVGTLLSRDGMTGVFNATKNNSYANFDYCLPCEWVEEEKSEPKYRPYTMSEFKSEFKIGMVLTLRNRDTPDYVCQVMYLGNRQYDESDSNNNTIFLSQRFFSLRELFNMFEIVRDGEWQPFGVLEND